jgi:hypothetical protein
MKDTDRVELLDPNYNWDESIPEEADWITEWEGTWKEFVDANADGFEGTPEEVQEIAGTLDRGETHWFGGGASSLFFLKKVAHKEGEGDAL